MTANKQLLLPGLVAMIVLFVFIPIKADISAQTQDDQDQLQLGASIFAENCAVCHGEEGEGRIGASLAKDWPAIRPDLTVGTIIEEGVPGTAMIAWSQKNGGPLSNEEINALVAYILNWQTGERISIPTNPVPTKRPPITPIPEVEGDPNQGAVLYDENCAICHGLEGEGRIGASLTKVWPGVRPDLSIKNTINTGVPGSAMPAWGQANGGPLTEEDIDDIVSFILSQPASPSSQALPTTVVISPAQFPWLRGFGGVLLFIILLIIIFGAAVYFQRKQ
jgi:mono/diheme cytochrome c family protein